MNSKKIKNDIDLEKVHTNDLGLGVPEDYFSTSKSELLAKIASEKKTKIVLLYQNKLMWFVAAGIALLMALTVFKPNAFPGIDKNPSIVSDTINKFQNLDLVYNLFLNDAQDITVASLFMDETEISNYITNNIIEELLIDEEIDYFMLEEILHDDLDLN